MAGVNRDCHLWHSRFLVVALRAGRDVFGAGGGGFGDVTFDCDGLLAVEKAGGWDEGATLGVLWKSALAALLCYVVAFSTQRWLGIALAGFDTSQTREILKLGARGIVVCGGAVAGTLTFLLAAGVLGAGIGATFQNFWQNFQTRKSLNAPRQ